MTSIKKVFATKSVRFFKSIIDLFNTDHNKYHLYAMIKQEFDCNIIIPTKNGKILFYCPNELLIWRAHTLLSKEPETIEWIDSFDDNDFFWDIGANVGCYSLYAGKKGLKTYSFEPQSANFYILNKNIQINNLDEKICAICIAFSDNNFFGILNIPNLELGGALNWFGEPVDEFYTEGHNCRVTFHQGTIGFSIDEFIKNYDSLIPNHIKIDVDGIEKEILLGASSTLKNKNLKSILVEMDENDVDYVNDVIEYLEQYGLKLESKKHSDMVENGDFRSVYNYIFRRVKIDEYQI